MESFVHRRMKYVNNRGRVALILGVLLIGTYIFIFFDSPMLANPFYIQKLIEQGLPEPEILIIGAAMLPIVTTMLFSTMLVFIIFTWAALTREYMYIRLIERLEQKIEDNIPD